MSSPTKLQTPLRAICCGFVVQDAARLTVQEIGSLQQIQLYMKPVKN